MHPDYKLSFPEWILQIESQLNTGERFYVGCTGIVDAIPYVWKNMSPDMGTQVFNAIKEFYDEAQQADEEPCSVNNIRKLIPFFLFDKIPKILG